MPSKRFGPGFCVSTIATVRRVCIVTTSPLTSNPRVVKEAIALADAGYKVIVIRGPALPEARFGEIQLNSQLSTRCPIVSIEWNRSIGFRQISGLKQRLCRTLFRWRSLTAELAYCRLFNVVYGGTLRQKPDLIIAHNLTALPPAFQAAKKMNVPIAFDAEDFHNGQLPDTREFDDERRLTQLIERKYMPHCNHVTAASNGIGEAYARELGIAVPTTILNVFPLRDRSVQLADDQFAAEGVTGCRSLYWFSQTIGRNRGLENVVRSLAFLPEDICLVLRGWWEEGYESNLRGMAKALGVNSRLHSRPAAPPEEMVARASCHDVGLALETPSTVNRDLCVTNKLFTYLSAGIPCVLSDTSGQRPFATELPRATLLVPQDDPQSMANSILALLSHGEMAREAAAEAAARKYNWELESAKLIAYVNDLLEPTNASS